MADTTRGITTPATRYFPTARAWKAAGSPSGTAETGTGKVRVILYIAENVS